MPGPDARTSAPRPALSRHEYGKLVAVLCDARGLTELARSETDAARAVRLGRRWKLGSGDAETLQVRLLRRADPTLAPRADVYGSLGRLLLACCDSSLAGEHQRVLVMRLVCGLSQRQIARALGEHPAAIAAQLAGAREQLASVDPFDAPDGDLRAQRMTALGRCLHWMHDVARARVDVDAALRRELSQEAMRLCLFSLEALRGGPDHRALMALICLDGARMVDLDEAGLLQSLLGEGDRSKWDRELIERGLKYLGESAVGRAMTSYHLEASIAAKQCVAERPADVDWPGIQELYLKLLSVRPHPVFRLHLALVSARVDGAAAALAHLERLRDVPVLQDDPALHAIGAYLCMEAGDRAGGRVHREHALALIDDPAQRRLVQRRLRGLGA